MIIVSTQCFPPAIGGIENLVFSLASEFHALGQDIRVYADHTGHDSQQEYDDAQPFPISRYGGFRPFRSRNKAADIHKCSMNQPKQQRVLLTDTWKSLEHIDSNLFNRIICLAHGSEYPAGPARSKFSRITTTLGKADLIIANSNFTASRLSDYCDDEDKIKVVTPGITRPETDPDLMQQAREELMINEVVLITIARLEKRKGHNRVISIMPQLVERYPTITYLIIGDGPCRKQLMAECVEKGVEEHVRFVGSLTGPRKGAYLANSDIFVMPGIRHGNDVEGFGLAYIEAGYFGLPSVASSIGGAAEAVSHGVTGLICDPDNPAELQDALVRLIEDREFGRCLGQNATKKAKSCLWQEKIRDYAAHISDR